MSMAASAKIAQASSPVAKKPLYEGSTQYKNWRFSPEELTRIRASLNAAAVSVIRNTFEADEVCCNYFVSLRCSLTIV
jgi:cyclin H